jgi:NAD(P)-dependent dehydrogenase (short-subunit alcohol dehydrogenase family)
MPSYVIAGASRGLGYQWLKTLSADKANTVIGLARTPGPVNDNLTADGISNVHVLKADLVDNKSLTAAAAEVSKLTGSSVDYLIVNAAYQNHKTASLTPTSFIGHEDLLVQEMRQSLDVGVIGVIQTINAFLPLVRKSSIKKIIAISSGMADFEFVEQAEIAFGVAYGATKAALNLVIIKYGIELKDEGIAVLALSPGLIDTREEPRE